MLIKLNKNIILENTKEFSDMMRQQAVSGGTPNIQNIHLQMRLADGTDAQQEAEFQKNKIQQQMFSNNMMNEKQHALHLQNKGLKF